MKSRWIVLLFCCYANIFGSELLKNGNFADTTSAGLPRHWVFRSENTEGSKVQNGVFKLKCHENKSLFLIQYNLPLKEGAKYKFSYGVRSSSSSQYRIYFEWVRVKEDGQKEFRSAGSNYLNARQEWQDAGYEFVCPAGFAPAYIAVHMRYAGEIEIKDLKLEELPAAQTKASSNPGREWSSIKDSGAVLSVDAGKGILIKGIPVEADSQYELSFSARGNQDSGSVTGYQNFRATAIFGDHGNTASPWDDAWSQSPQNKKFRFKTPPHCREMSLRFTTSATSSVSFSNLSLVKVIDDSSSKYAIVITSPIYRNTIYSSHPVSRITGYIETDKNVKEVDFTLSTGTEKLSSQKGLLENGQAKFNFDLEDREANEFTVSATVHAATSVDKQTVIKKLPPGKIEVLMGIDKNFYVNGKLFFPVSFWNLSMTEEVVYEATRHGINLVRVRPNTEEEALRYLNLADKYGAKLVFALDHAKAADGEKFRSWLHKVENVLTPTVLAHQALFGYFLVDEPWWSGIPLNNLLACYEKYKELDPYRPVWINAAPRGSIEEQSQYAAACDIYGVDIYPIPFPNEHSGLDDKSITSVGKYAERSRQITKGQKPIWMALQGFAWAEVKAVKAGEAFIYPTLSESRFMAYDSFVNHAASIGYWGTNYIQEPAFIDTLLTVCDEIREISTVLARGNRINDISASDPKLKCSLYQYGQYYCLVVLNYSPDQIRGKLKMPTVNGQLEVFKENRRIQLKDGILQDEFKPYDIHVYLSGPLPEPLFLSPPVDSRFDGSKPFHKASRSRQTVKPYTGNANWIWHKDKVQEPSSRVILCKEFNLPEKIKTAVLKIAADDHYTVFINDKKLAQGGNWDVMSVYHCPGLIRNPGKNRITIEGQDAGSLPCGVIMDLELETVPGRKINIISDASWKSHEAIDSNNALKADITSWQDAFIVAPYGKGAWGKRVREKLPEEI